MDFNPVYLFYLLIGVSAAMFAEGVYLLAYNKASYRKNINRRLKVLDARPDRESVLVQLRRERGLTSAGDYRLPLLRLNRLMLQSGVSLGLGKLMLVAGMLAIGGFVATMVFDGKIVHALLAIPGAGVVLPILALTAGRRQSAADRRRRPLARACAAVSGTTGWSINLLFPATSAARRCSPCSPSFRHCRSAAVSSRT